MRESSVVILDEQLFQHLLLQVRKAQGKLYQVKGGRELADELDWSIKVIDLTSYGQGDHMLERLMDEQGLTFIE